jgi:hypothetical protein
LSADGLALVVAIVAVTVSLLSFAWTIGWSIYQHRKVTRGQLHVSTDLEFMKRLGAIGFFVTVTNQGVVPVTVASVYVEVANPTRSVFIREWIAESPGPLDQLLQPGALWFGFADRAGVERQLAKISSGQPPSTLRIGVKDAAGRTYFSNRVKIT